MARSSIHTEEVAGADKEKKLISGEEQERKIMGYEEAMHKIKEATGVSDIQVHLTTYKARSYIYIYFCARLAENNMSLTPVSQVKYRNSCPKQFKLY